MWPSEKHLRQLYRNSVSLNELHAFSAMDTTEIHGKNGGFVCRNGPIVFNGMKRDFQGACFLNAVISMLSFTDILPSSNEIILLAYDKQMIAGWQTLRQSLMNLGAQPISIQSYTIFLMCCAWMDIDTYLISPVDLGYGDSSELFLYKISNDGTITKSYTSKDTNDAIVVHVDYVIMSEGWKFVGIFVNMNRDSKPGHDVVARAHLQDNGSYQYELFDSDEENTKSFENFDSFLLYLHTYLFPSIYLKYVYMRIGSRS